MVAMRGMGRLERQRFFHRLDWLDFCSYGGGSEADSRPVAQEDSSHDAGHRERGPGRGTDKNPPPAQEGDMAVSCFFFRPLNSRRYQAPLEMLPEG